MVTEVTSATVAVLQIPRPAAPSRPDGAQSGADAGGAAGAGRSGGTAASDNVSQANANQQTTRQDNQKASEEALKDAVRHLSERVQNVRRELHFNIDDDTGETVVKVIDSQSHEVIRQIPAEEVLQMVRHLQEMEKEASQEASPGLILRTSV